MHPYEFAVQGPFKTKVKGGSLGINLLPAGPDAAQDRSIFHQTGPENPADLDMRPRNIPSAGVIVTCSARRIIELSKGGEKVTQIRVGGQGEPTLHPGFQEITENLRDLRDKWFPKAKLMLFSRAVELAENDVRHLMMIYDRPVLRFEWGTAKTFQAFTGIPSTQLKLLQEELTGMDRLVVQACFRKQGAVDNGTDSEVKNWLKRLAAIQPAGVELTTPQTKAKGIRAATPAKLEKIAAQVSELLPETPVDILDPVPQPA